LKIHLYPPAARTPDDAPESDDLRAECARPGGTRQLLWEEYRVAQPDGMSRSAFYRHCQPMERRAPVLKNDYTGGEYLFVDYSGKRLSYTDRDAGVVVPVEIFVASWGASSGTYVEATRTQSARDFVYAHVNAFAYFGCVPKVVTPDNLKSAVTTPARADPVLCQLYRKFAEHYDLVILPARVAKPRDTATAESAVCCTQQRVLAPLRNQQFFSLAEINAAMAPLREALADRPMKEYQGQSRRERFQLYDLPAARPLPAERFQVSDACYDLRVPANYLVKYDQHYYSVPCALIDHHVNVFLSGDVLEIYHHAAHVVRHAKQPPDGRQTVIDAHRPENHRQVCRRSKEYYLHAAEVIGPFTAVLVEGIYTRKKHDELAHRAAQGVIRLCKVYDSSRVEAAAERAVYFSHPTLHDLKQILSLGLDRQPLPGAGQRQFPLMAHMNLRGADYYQGEEPLHIETVGSQLRGMKLSVMADALPRRLAQGEQHSLAPDDFFALLVDEECTARIQRRVQRMLAAADFKPEQACLENVLGSPARGLNQLTLARFTTDAWITQATNVVITGATGVGKTYLAEAIGAQACRGGHAVRKLRYKHFFEEVNAARGTGCLLKYLRKLQQTPVLILDDFLMAAVPVDDLTNFLEVMEERHQVGSLIVTTQYPLAEWHRLIPDPTLADAICDRLAHTSVIIRLQGESMRKRATTADQSGTNNVT